MAIRMDNLPAGRYAVGVSGGADSVALLLLLTEVPGLSVHVVHLNHQTRGEASDGDAAFVASLARRLEVPCTVALREELEQGTADLPANASARYRALRLALFRSVCQQHGLAGVVLAHHADDQAETIMHRLLRGSLAPAGLAGMSARSTVGGLDVYRPLLGATRAELRRYLTSRGEAWREDASNASDRYLRNRIRKVLADRPELSRTMVDLGAACAGVRDWMRRAAPVLGETFRIEQVNEVPAVLAREAVRRWLVAQGVPAGEVEPAVVERVLRLAGDAASPPVVNLPTGLAARRRAGVVSVGQQGKR